MWEFLAVVIFYEVPDHPIDGDHPREGLQWSGAD